MQTAMERMKTVRKYRITKEGPRLVDETTPNEVWDAHGHLYLMIEEKGRPVTLDNLLWDLKTYNRENNAVFPDDAVSVREALGMLINAGLLEAYEQELP